MDLCVWLCFDVAVVMYCVMRAVKNDEEEKSDEGL